MTEEQEQLAQAVYRASLAFNQAITEAHDNDLRVKLSVNEVRAVGVEPMPVLTTDVAFPIYSRVHGE